MEQIYNKIMSDFGYAHLVCDIFLNWENVKDEILLSERKNGSGNGTVHVFLGAADTELQQEFSDYYESVAIRKENPALGAIRVKHYFLKSNVISMLGYVCQYYKANGKKFESEVSDILDELSISPKENECLTAYSDFKLSMGSNKLRPYFKKFEEKGAFYKIIRHLLLPQSAYKIALYKNVQGEYAAFWLIGFGDLNNFEANSCDSYTKKKPVVNLPLQQIYYGAPGTGKSYKIDEYTQKGGYAAIRTTFHPDSDYSTFVGAYKPTMNGERITYSFVKQAFLKAYLLAWKKYSEKSENVDPQFLVIEEINRGNCAQIFGDIFQLLDRQDNGFSSYPIEADADLQAEIKKSFEHDEAYKISNDFDINGVVKHYVSNYGQNLTKDVIQGRVLLLPNNLYIWATMNTSDQSLFPIDSAFKRRWDWKYVKISNAYKGWMIKCGTEACDWWTFVEAINKEIADKCESEDKKLGYFFCKPKGGEDFIDEERFVGKVLFYLWNDVFKDIDTSLFKLEVDTEETPAFDAFYTQNEKGETIVDTKSIRQFLVNIVGEDNLIADFTESNSVVSVKGSPRFELDGNGIFDNMMNTVRNVVKKYADAHPAETADGIMNVFNEVCNDNDFKITNDFILETEAMHSHRMAQKQKTEKVVELDLGGRGKLFVNRYWTSKNREVFIRKAKEMQWGIIEQVKQ